MLQSLVDVRVHGRDQCSFMGGVIDKVSCNHDTLYASFEVGGVFFEPFEFHIQASNLLLEFGFSLLKSCSRELL